jgi:hypothetical protein
VLLTNIRAIGAQPVVLAPEDLPTELANTVWLTASTEERGQLAVTEVVRAFEEAVRDLGRRLVADGVRHSGTFYVWHDDQAGQLRCSVSSREPADLPFSGQYRPTNDLAPIVAAFLNDDAPGQVAWQELEQLDVHADGESAGVAPLQVWTVTVAPGT